MMRARQWWMGLACGILILAMTACGGSDDSGPARDAASIPAPSPVATVSPARLHLQRAYELLSQSHKDVSAIWEGLATGEQIQCGTGLDIPQPEAITSEGDSAQEPLADALRQAAIDLHEAADLWRAECANPRTTIPASVIDQGRLAVRSAGDSLTTAQELLGGLQN
jgi:hypothetical protein